MQLLVASNNPKKLAELERILAAAGVQGVELVSLREVEAYEEPVEYGRTFADNALIKARAGAQATGLATVADDSGLAVEELGGMPGVLSARWSGTHGDDQANNDLLLAQMADVPDERRAVAFVSVCALVTPDGTERVSEGRWEGRLLREEVGENGFGYDPLFVPAEEDAPGGAGRSSAQLSLADKDALSHRGKALGGLVAAIAELASA
ncbi:non-canonical purine NTP pyrophosphatase [Corynebacterium yudongzhengii]|uniref:dITP/XTP pyrophosphatase n=1 Tax=Corynebacterium yudongzhengii TaxID=2080740 RepID=A0A2U1T8X5_9CORY|nr:non-canonical purine NTP pyrophosphatase [Corynebacterium yudongzhengii]AWB82549.1 non-canonical purine NTP pyrophosphatase [Corynebacterium yudongzhengii]PWC02395.1 non-canonical purine NTP pyrophosphatase [Corynebacterium yudongzhengii]